MTTLVQDRPARAPETARVADLMAALPRGGSILEIGARNGFISARLAEKFDAVVALDIVRPAFDIPGVRRVQADVTALPFGGGAFDVVLCSEVLEHVPAVEKACRELARVARRTVVVGVPYRQDTRCGRTTCPHCGTHNPPWGHVNRFDEERLRRLFAGMHAGSTSFVGSTADATNCVSRLLNDWGGNPWGTYDQDERCVGCGGKLARPARRGIARRICPAAAGILNRIQRRFTLPHANWIHMVFEKK